MNKDLTMEQIEDIRERVKSGLDVLRSNVIGHQIILGEIRKRVMPLGVELSDEKIMEMSEQDFMDLIDYETGLRQKKEIKYHYEKQVMTCKVGDILHNNNGSDYRVLEKYSDTNILFQNIETGAFSVGVGVGFFRKLPKPTEKEITEAKKIISDFCRHEFTVEEEFKDLPIVVLGTAEDTIGDSDEKCIIQVKADLENFKIITEVDGNAVGVEQYRSMEDFIEYALECLSYDSLISLSDDELAVARGEKKLEPDMTEVCIEWGHGIHLSNIPSEIDFAELKREYGREPEPNAKGEFDIEIREVLSRTESVKAGFLGEAINELMDKYKRGEIVLDAEDFKGVDYIPVQKKEGR